VGTDWIENRKNMMFFSGRAHPELAEQVAKELDVHVTAQTARDFANGEIFVRFEESVRGCDAFVLQSHPAPLNKWLMEQLIMIDALKRGSAKRITAILPFYPYARQDKKHSGASRSRGGWSLTCQDWGADRIVVERTHRPDPGLLRRARRPHAAEPSDRPHRRELPENMVVVSPDQPGAHRREAADALGGTRWRSSQTRDPGCASRWCPTASSVTSRAALADRRHDRHRRHDAGAAGHDDGAVTSSSPPATGALDLAAQRADSGVVGSSHTADRGQAVSQLTVPSIAPYWRAPSAVLENGSATGLFDGDV
jgi:ribose-phosphate pyrophosphokinase